MRRAGAAALDLAYVAAGRLDAFWEMGLSRWDMAAGALLIQEAGGLVGDLQGGAGLPRSRRDRRRDAEGAAAAARSAALDPRVR